MFSTNTTSQSHHSLHLSLHEFTFPSFCNPSFNYLKPPSPSPSLSLSIYIYICMYVCMYKPLSPSLSLSLYIYICMYVCMCVCVQDQSIYLFINMGSVWFRKSLWWATPLVQCMRGPAHHSTFKPIGREKAAR